MTTLKKIWHGFTAAVTSPTAVKQEKSLATLILVRVAIAAGATGGLVEIIPKIING